MSDIQPFDLTSFKELHLLPRTIFLVGGVVFLGAFYLHSLSIGLSGLAAVFFGVGFNLFIDVIGAKFKKPSAKDAKTEDVETKRLWWWWGIIQAIACAAITAILVCLAVHHRVPLPCPSAQTAQQSSQTHPTTASALPLRQPSNSRNFRPINAALEARSEN